MDAASAFANAERLAPTSELRLQAARRLLDVRSEGGGTGDTIAPLQTIVALAPSDRDAWRRLALARSHVGDSKAAAEAWWHVLGLDAGNLEASAFLMEFLANAGDYASAAPHARVLAEAAPRDLRAAARLADLLERAGDAGGAVEAWTSAAKLDREGIAPHARLAALHKARGDISEATRQLQIVAERSPGDPEAWRTYALAVRGGDDIPRTISAWQGLLRANGDDPQAHAELGNLFYGLKRHNDAVPHLRFTADREPDRTKIWKRLAHTLRGAGDIDGAIQAWRHIEGIDPDGNEAEGQIFQLLYDNGRKAEALAHLRAASILHQDRVDLWRRIAELEQELGDDEAAIASWRRVMALGGDDLQAHVQLASLLFEAGRKAEASPHLRVVAERDRRLKPWKRLAESLPHAGDRPGAVAAWETVLEIGGAELEAHASLANLLEQLEQPAQAVPHLRALLDREPSSKGWARLARAQQRAGRDEEAIAAWRGAIAFSADDRTAHAALAEMLAAAGDSEGALDHLQALADLAPNDGKPWRRLALAAREAGDRARSVVAWRRVLELGGREAEAHGHLGDLLYELGLRDEALPHMQASAQQHPTRSKLWRRLAELLHGAGDLSAAIQAWETALALDGDAATRLRIVDASVAGGRPVDAIRHLRVMAEEDAGDTALWRRLSQLLETSGQIDDAVSLWVRRLELDADDRDAHGELARLYWDLKRTQQAVPHLRWLSQSSPADMKVKRRLARALHATGDDQAAIEAWRAVLSVEPEDREAHTELVGLFTGLGDARGAMAHQKALAFNSPDLRVLRRYTRAVQATGDIAETLAGWAHLLDTEPNDGEALQQTVSVLQAAGRDEEATVYLRRWAEAVGNDEKLWKRLAKTLAKLGRTGEAAVAWERSFELTPDEPSRRRILADLYEQAGRDTEATPHLRWLADNAEGDPARAMIRLARALGRQGELEQEADAWRQVLRWAQDNVDAMNRLAAHHTQAGNLAEATPYIRMLAEREPGQVKPWRRLGQHLQNAADREAEVEAWRTVLTLQANDFEAHSRLAELFVGMGLWDQVRRHVEALAAREPDAVKHRQRLARSAQKSRSADEALQAWREVLEMRPDDLEAHEHVVLNLDRLGRSDEARPSLQLLAGATPQKMELWRRLSPVGEGVDAEIAWWKRILEIAPDDRELVERIALFLHGLGRKSEAVPYFRRLTRLSPQDALAWRRLARCLTEIGDSEGAAEARGMVDMIDGMAA